MLAIRKFIKNSKGATAIEYGLIAALISVICITVWQSIGTNLLAKFTEVNTALTQK